MKKIVKYSLPFLSLYFCTLPAFAANNSNLLLTMPPILAANKAMVCKGVTSEFVQISIHPEHVEVFTTLGTQQFGAYGFKRDGTTTNVTSQVYWTSSDNSIVTIDATGLATIVPGHTIGQVLIGASSCLNFGLPFGLYSYTSLTVIEGQ